MIRVTSSDEAKAWDLYLIAALDFAPGTGSKDTLMAFAADFADQLLELRRQRMPQESPVGNAKQTS